MAYVGDQKREYQRKWIAARRAIFFANKSCAVCGSLDRLELDHIDPEKKISHNIWSWTEARRLEEIAKCQVLCNEHHLEKTKTQAFKRYCPKQHDKLEVGIESDARTCSECRRIKDRQARAEGRKK